jgi:GDP-L-fucose synthase
MQKYDSPDIVNIGTGLDSSIKEIANLIKKVTCYSGNLEFDESKPDGTPRKLLNVDKINNLGWKSSVDLLNGIETTYQDFELNYSGYIKPKHIKSIDLINV